MAESKKKPNPVRLRALLPDLIALIKPRQGQLLLGLVLIIIARIASLALPASTRYLIDDVIGKKQYDLLNPLVGVVLLATIVQAGCSFALSQILSKAAQRLITEMRKKIQIHIGRLPVAYFDTHKTGELVSRIMNDVEGLRNLVGTGLVELLGGVLTAILALVVLFYTSAMLTGLALVIVIGVAAALFYFFNKLRPVFKERGKIQAEVTGRLQETLGGTRVIKGYRAEEREETVFAKGVDRLLENVLKSLTGVSAMSVSAVVILGFVGSLVMWIGTNKIIDGTLTLGQFITFTAFLAFLVAPIFGIVSVGSPLSQPSDARNLSASMSVAVL